MNKDFQYTRVSVVSACASVGSPSQRHSTIALAQDIFETHQGTHILQVSYTTFRVVLLFSFYPSVYRRTDNVSCGDPRIVRLLVWFGSVVYYSVF